MAEMVAAEGLEAYSPELGTYPRVLYKNLYRWRNVFVAASVAYRDTGECAEGAVLTACREDAEAGEGGANTYGEVVGDGLDPGAEYEVTISADGYKTFTNAVKLDESLNIGLALLEKA